MKTKKMILVTGATGTFGKALITKLQKKQIDYRAVSLDSFDWNKPETFEKSLKPEFDLRFNFQNSKKR